MASTTFSGPIKAGTISNTTGTTVGTDVKNIGFVKMAQTASWSQSTTAADTGIVDASGNIVTWSQGNVSYAGDGGDIYVRYGL